MPKLCKSSRYSALMSPSSPMTGRREITPIPGSAKLLIQKAMAFFMYWECTFILSLVQHWGTQPSRKDVSVGFALSARV